MPVPCARNGADKDVRQHVRIGGQPSQGRCKQLLTGHLVTAGCSDCIQGTQLPTVPPFLKGVPGYARCPQVPVLKVYLLMLVTNAATGAPFYHAVSLHVQAVHHQFMRGPIVHERTYTCRR